MIYIKLKENEIEYIHHMPFDETYGIGKTRDELEQNGIFVDSIQEADLIEGKQATLKYDGTKLYYEYVDRPLSPEEELKQLKDQLASAQEVLDFLLMGGM